jgi:hypothetical protein
LSGSAFWNFVSPFLGTSFFVDIAQLDKEDWEETVNDHPNTTSVAVVG